MNDVSSLVNDEELDFPLAQRTFDGCSQRRETVAACTPRPVHASRLRVDAISRFRRVEVVAKLSESLSIEESPREIVLARGRCFDKDCRNRSGVGLHFDGGSLNRRFDHVPGQRGLAGVGRAANEERAVLAAGVNQGFQFSRPEIGAARC